MKIYPVCDGVLSIVDGLPQCFVDSSLTTLGTWSYEPVPTTDFQGLIDLLTFSPEICASLVGGCLVIFIIGFSSAKVARILSRR